MWATTRVRDERGASFKHAILTSLGGCADVSGVAWSSDDAYLASVGLDSTVLIWSGQNFGASRTETAGAS